MGTKVSLQTILNHRQIVYSLTNKNSVDIFYDLEFDPDFVSGQLVCLSTWIMLPDVPLITALYALKQPLNAS